MLAGASLPGLTGAYITNLNIIVMAFVYMGIVRGTSSFSLRSMASLTLCIGLMWGYHCIQTQLLGARPLPDEHHIPQLLCAVIIIYGAAENAAFLVRRYAWSGLSLLPF